MIQKTQQVIKRIDFDPGFSPVFFTPVIRRELLSGLDQAQIILRTAKKEAESIREKAREVLENAKTEREEEKKRGFEQGYEEGLGQVSQRLMSIAQSHEKILQTAEPQIIRMIMDISEKVIGCAMDKGAIVDVVKQAIHQSVGQKVIVRVHPSDAIVVREKQPEILSSVGDRSFILIKEDETVPIGGCMIETEFGSVDARLETQLSAIRNVLGLEIK